MFSHYPFNIALVPPPRKNVWNCLYTANFLILPSKKDLPETKKKTACFLEKNYLHRNERE
jgi:hypothetical protein